MREAVVTGYRRLRAEGVYALLAVGYHDLRRNRGYDCAPIRVRLAAGNFLLR